jgi:predicted porin
MKKSIIATAVAAGVLATGAAQASPTVYGILHLSIDTFSDAHYGPGGSGDLLVPDEPEMKSNTSAIGVKGSEDLGGGLKAIYKAEFRIDPFSGDPSGGSLQRRDVWVGLKGGWGKVAVGTMSSNYKQMGGKIDPFYRTVAEGRGILNMQSELHAGAGNDGQGRSTQTLQYTTPKMAGIEIVLNTTLSAAGSDCTDPGVAATAGCDETIGIGARWSNKNWLLYVDYIDPNAQGTGAFGSPATGQFLDESAAKVGGKWSNDAFQVSAQYEMTEDQLGGDYMFLNGLWNINKANAVTVSYGQQDKISSAYAIGYVFSMSKQTNVYAAWGSVEADSNGSYILGADGNPGTGFKQDGVTPQNDGSVLSLGIRKSF